MNAVNKTLDPVPMTLNELARKHYETGCYGRAHLRMRRADLDQIERPTPNSLDFTNRSLAWLTGIPVIEDPDVGANLWKLVDNSTREVLDMGYVK